MQTRTPLSKAERQRLVASLVERMQLGTQQELLDALESAGCRVTQATVSRDIRELGLEKARDPLGRDRYVLPNRRRRSTRARRSSRCSSQFGRGAVAAQNLVVSSRRSGRRRRSRARSTGCDHPLVIGTLAGDDTCLVIAADAERAHELADELRAAMR